MNAQIPFHSCLLLFLRLEWDFRGTERDFRLDRVAKSLSRRSSEAKAIYNADVCQELTWARGQECAACQSSAGHQRAGSPSTFGEMPYSSEAAFSHPQKPLPPNLKPLVSGSGRLLLAKAYLLGKPTGYSSRPWGVRGLEGARPRW